MIDVEGGNNLMYVPLDAILRNQGVAPGSGGLGARESETFVTSENDTGSGFDSDRRSRGNRQ